MKDQTKIQLREEFNKSFDAEYPSVRSYTAGKLQDFVADFWLSKIDSLLQSQRDELVENHYCCKYKTVKKEDFCDACLSLINQNN